MAPDVLTKSYPMPNLCKMVAQTLLLLNFMVNFSRNYKPNLSKLHFDYYNMIHFPLSLL
jgi:hypothetical protein